MKNRNYKYLSVRLEINFLVKSKDKQSQAIGKRLRNSSNDNYYLQT